MNNNSPHIEPELLSAYLDNEITTAERAVIEAHLPGCVACQTELASLRWTVSLVQALPQPTIPRTFYITEAMLSPEPTPRQAAAPWWRIFAPWGALVAALLVVVVFARPMLMGGGAPAAAPASETSAFEAAPVPEIAVAPTGAAAGGAAGTTDSTARSSDTVTTMATTEVQTNQTTDTAEAPPADSAVVEAEPTAKTDEGALDDATPAYSVTAPIVGGADTGATTADGQEPEEQFQAEILASDTPPAPNTTLIVATIVVLLVIISAVIIRGLRT